MEVGRGAKGKNGGEAIAEIIPGGEGRGENPNGREREGISKIKG